MSDHDQGAEPTVVRLANRIGEFFAVFPDREEAIDGVANHIRKFWEPRMRCQLYAHLDGPAAGAGLSELVLATAQARRTLLLPQS